MARGNKILITENPRGKFFEGIITGTPLPGTVMQLETGTAVDGNGVHTWVVYQPGTDGDRPVGPIAVALEKGEGFDNTTAYVTGDRGFLYVPLPGDELNMRWSAAGTGAADAVTVGLLAVVDTGTGLLVDTTGSPQTEPFVAMEAVDDVTATGTLVWCMATGY